MELHGLVFVLLNFGPALVQSSLLEGAVNTWRSEDKLWESVLFYHVGPREQTRVVRSDKPAISTAWDLEF